MLEKSSVWREESQLNDILRDSWIYDKNVSNERIVLKFVLEMESTSSYPPPTPPRFSVTATKLAHTQVEKVGLLREDATFSANSTLIFFIFPRSSVLFLIC